MTITIRDVARAAGVSTATVSRALRGLPYVDEATRVRVLEVAASLDYVASPSASRLASGRTDTVAVVTPDIGRWFFSTILAGIEEVTVAHGLDLLLVSAGNPERPQPALAEQRLRQRVDGAIVIGLSADNPEVQGLVTAGVRLSLVGTTVEGVPSLVIDDGHTARTAVQHLLDLGHRDIAVISGAPGASPVEMQESRQRGYLESLTNAGVEIDPNFTVYGRFTTEGGREAMSQLLAREYRPSAVFCMSDEMAFGALTALREAGLVAGVDISVVGIDGHPQAEALQLTTVEQPVVEMGRLAAEGLISAVELSKVPSDDADLPQAQVVPTSLVARASTAPYVG